MNFDNEADLTQQKLSEATHSMALESRPTVYSTYYLEKSIRLVISLIYYYIICTVYSLTTCI